ncbi:hypothetical protein AVEN_17757-1 [Araneus ventricosus]|uniref:Paired domain-containing protein n=1 Tax=Araneus ventricosus TaxID=182803 RepID=A0A4Y2BCL8_ARAVE|nr:hypothetical protein AVEN_263425-1 [Araneus ventricosus]GBL89033.1 hypothetical protein AVEN_17757-1 [Araneus ventricosus]
MNEDNFTRGRIVGAVKEIPSIRDVVNEFRISKNAIGRLCERFYVPGTVTRYYSSGRPGEISANEDPYVQITAKRNRRITAVTLAQGI